MTPERLQQHLTILRECEAGGAKPRVYRELIEALLDDHILTAELRLEIEQLSTQLFSVMDGIA